MTQRPGNALRADVCFNSATALQPWMTRRKKAATHCCSKLQFGHGLAAVDDALEAFAPVVETLGLQFGHGLAAVDDFVSVVEVDPLAGASIRPRPCSRG